jgi:hypothetical protein
VLYLPDFDEQYAVEVKPGLGMAAGGIGMENGWMVERAAVQVDNRELGKFVFNNLQKGIDLGLDTLKTAIAPGSVQAQAAAEAAAKAIAQAGEERRPVLLRIRYVVEAQPGMYPILKPKEIASLEKKGNPAKYVYVPYPPVTVVGYDARVTVLVELLDTTSAGTQKPATSAAKPRRIEAVDQLKQLKDFVDRYTAWADRKFRKGKPLKVDELLGSTSSAWRTDEGGTRQVTIYTDVAASDLAELNTDIITFMTKQSNEGKGLAIGQDSVTSLTFAARTDEPKP